MLQKRGEVGGEKKHIGYGGQGQVLSEVAIFRALTANAPASRGVRDRGFQDSQKRGASSSAAF